jgi:hypothetical protein
MQTQSVTLIGIICTLGGAFGGQLLTRSWQHKQWLRDKRFQDYQDVLSAVTTAYMALIRPNPLRPNSLDIEAAKDHSFTILRDRIFIADDLALYRILEDWDAAVTNYEWAVKHGGDRDGKAFGLRFNELNGRLVCMALQTPKGPGRFARWRNRRALAKYRTENPF